MGDPFLDVLPLVAAAGSSRPGDPGRKAPAATCRCLRSSGRRCAFSPPPRLSTWPRPSTRATGRRCSWAPTAACGSGSWPAPPKPGRPASRSGHRGRDPRRGQGQADHRPPKTRAGRRTVGLPPFVLHELEVHLAAARRPGSHVFTAPSGGPLRVPSFRARFWVPATRRPACRACASMTFAITPWRCGSPPARRPRRSPCVLGTPRSASPSTATVTRRSPAGRGGPVPSSKD